MLPTLGSHIGLDDDSEKPLKNFASARSTADAVSDPTLTQTQQIFYSPPERFSVEIDLYQSVHPISPTLTASTGSVSFKFIDNVTGVVNFSGKLSDVTPLRSTATVDHLWSALNGESAYSRMWCLPDTNPIRRGFEGDTCPKYSRVVLEGQEKQVRDVISKILTRSENFPFMKAEVMCRWCQFAQGNESPDQMKGKKRDLLFGKMIKYRISSQYMVNEPECLCPE